MDVSILESRKKSPRRSSYIAFWSKLTILSILGLTYSTTFIKRLLKYSSKNILFECDRTHMASCLNLKIRYLAI